MTVFGYTNCRRGHSQSVHEIDMGGKSGEGCYGLQERPKRWDLPTWDDRSCGCAGYRTASPNVAGKDECVYFGIKFTWRGRRRMFCPKCERRCPHCRAYSRGGTHCHNCGKSRGLSIEEFARKAPPLSDHQRRVIANAFSTHERHFVPAPPRCVECGEQIPHPRPGLCDQCFVKLHGHPRTPIRQ